MSHQVQQIVIRSTLRKKEMDNIQLKIAKDIWNSVVRGVPDLHLIWKNNLYLALSLFLIVIRT